MSIYNFTAKSILGDEVSFDSLRGNTLLIVNTASHCGFTPQYEGLEKLYKEYKDKKFIVLGFPCNQFGNQEKGTEDEIVNFCRTHYQIDFPMFEKVKVNGKEAHPLFKYLSKEAPGLFGSKLIKWNFTKFLVNKEGKVIKRFAPHINPEQMISYIEKIL